MANGISSLSKVFLGESPKWYKITIVLFLIINPILLYSVGPFITGWVLIAEFIFTLAAALKCYPLPPGGLLAIEAVILKMTNSDRVYHVVSDNFSVILLLIFMVAGIHFLKNGLRLVFTKLITSVKSKKAISLLFCMLGAFLSAFLDALTVVAVIIAVAYGFYEVYSNYIGEEKLEDSQNKEDNENFRGFLRNLLMHAAVGTALGGAMTLVGEPQNLLIGQKMGWTFKDFFYKCIYISGPVLITGFVTCLLLETTKIFGYGYQLPTKVYDILNKNVEEKVKSITSETKLKLIAQALVGLFLILALAFHVAEVGLIGLCVIIFSTTFTGVTDENDFGDAFKDALPFTSLLVVFFCIVAVIQDQGLFEPLLNWVLSFHGKTQLLAFFGANGLLSAISDNVFVATIYITEVEKAYQAGAFDKEWLDKLAVAVNMGTNIPSVATPNGQAAFLFLLTSSVAPLIKLSYMEMVKLALPYTITMVTAGVLATAYLL